MKTKTLRTINEFCQNGKLDEYREVLTAIFNEIEKSDCKISARYDLPSSTHLEGHLRISLLDIYQKPVHIIWVILHEFGHFLSGPLEKENEFDWLKRVNSEEKAWLHAEQLLTKFTELIIHKADFKEFKEQCLKSYYEKLKTCANNQAF